MKNSMWKDNLNLIVARSKEVFWDCAKLNDDKLALTAGAGGNSYPFVYTRDLSIVIRYLVETKNYHIARQAVQFLASVQAPNGEWVQRYDVWGNRKEDKLQEDNTPLALWAMLTYLQAVDDDGEFERCVPIIRLGLDWIAKNLDSEVGLLFAHSSNHEDGVNQGFDLWTNSACLKALELAAEVLNWSEPQKQALSMRDKLLDHLVHEQRFVRTMDKAGNKKLDADIILLAPYYFQLLPPDDNLLINSVDYLCQRLEDKNIGGYWRYEQDVYLPGPWILYSAIIARYYYSRGERGQGDTILQWICDHTEAGYLPEHLTTKEMYWKYQEHQIRRANNMPVPEMKQARLAEIKRVEEQAKKKDVLSFACPLLWSHMETIAALLAAGYLQDFCLQEQGREQNVANQ